MKEFRHFSFQYPYDKDSLYYGKHAVEVIKQLGITYIYSIPQSMGDSWWFFGCTNLPDPLPEEFREFPCSLDSFVGFGLSQGQVDRLKQIELEEE